MIQIDKDVPFPGAPTKRAPKYPWATMEVGESFLVTAPPKYFQSMVGHAGRLHKGRKFACRSIDGGIRVWRIA